MQSFEMDLLTIPNVSEGMFDHVQMYWFQVTRFFNIAQLFYIYCNINSMQTEKHNVLGKTSFKTSYWNSIGAGI